MPRAETKEALSPLQPNCWQRIKKTFLPSNMEKLEAELQKNLKKQKPNKDV